MTESTSEYKKRIEEIKQSIENEPYMAKMREDIAEGISKTGIRQTTVEEQFQSVLDETTGKDVISAPELIAARNGKSNLKTRLDDEHAQVTAQLQQTEQELSAQLAQRPTQSYVDSKISQVKDGSPKGVFTTLVDLQTSYPTGNSNIYVVTADGKWYYWSGSAWTAGGVYQGTYDPATAFKLTNKLTNSDFSNGTTGWTGVGVSDFTVTNKVASFTTAGALTGIRQNKTVAIGDKLYAKALVKTANQKFYLTLAGASEMVNHSGSGDWEFLSIYFQPTQYTIGNMELLQSNLGTNGLVEVKYAVYVNLTEVYGAGKEPAKEYMDNLLKTLPNSHFNDTSTFSLLKLHETDKSTHSDIRTELATVKAQVEAIPVTPGTNKWAGKKAVFLGDSITYGSFLTDNVASRFSTLVGNDLSMTVNNYGEAGTRIGDYGTDTTNFAKRYTTMSDADIVFVLGGTNDYGHTTSNSGFFVPFGSFADTTDKTYYGALHVLYKGLAEKYMGKQIVIMTPLHRSGIGTQLSDDLVVNADTGKGLRDYVNAQRDVAEYYGIRVLDLYKELPLSVKINGLKTAYMPDGLHPNEAGHRMIADRIIAFVRSL